MPLYYIRERNNLNSDSGTLCTYEVRSKGCIDLKHLAKLVGRRYRSINEGELEAIASEFVRVMGEQLADGYSVSLGTLGNFSIRIGPNEDSTVSDPNGESRHRNSRSLGVKGLRFSPGKKFVDEIDRMCRLTSEGRGTVHLHNSPYSEAERQHLLTEYLKREKLIRVAEYAQLSKQSVTTASIELRKWNSDPSVPIGSNGKGSAKIYILKEV